MKTHVLRMLAFVSSILLTFIVLLAVYGTVTTELAKKSLADNDLLVKEGLPSIYENLRIISYNFSSSSMSASQVSNMNHGYLIITNQHDEVLFDGLVNEGDTPGITGYEVMILKIRAGLLPTSRGHMILRFTELNQP